MSEIQREDEDGSEGKVNGGSKSGTGTSGETASLHHVSDSTSVSIALNETEEKRSEELDPMLTISATSNVQCAEESIKNGVSDNDCEKLTVSSKNNRTEKDVDKTDSGLSLEENEDLTSDCTAKSSIDRLDSGVSMEENGDEKTSVQISENVSNKLDNRMSVDSNEEDSLSGVEANVTAGSSNIGDTSANKDESAQSSRCIASSSHPVEDKSDTPMECVDEPAQAAGTSSMADDKQSEIAAAAVTDDKATSGSSVPVLAPKKRKKKHKSYDMMPLRIRVTDSGSTRAPAMHDVIMGGPGEEGGSRRRRRDRSSSSSSSTSDDAGPSRT